MWLSTGRRISVNTSLTVNEPETGGVGPPEPAAVPACEAASGRKSDDSWRHSAPRFSCRPWSAVGILTLYLPRSPVMEPDTTYSVTDPSTSSGIDMYWTAAGVTPPGDQMFHGTQAASVALSFDKQVGAPPGPGRTFSALAILVLSR